MPFAAAVAAGGSLLSAGIGAISSSNAASAGSAAATNAANLQTNQFNSTQANLAPYNTVGQSAATQLQGLNTAGFTAGQPNYLALSQGAMPGQMTQAELQATPGYQFNLNQGLESTQNSAAARGLGVSGAAMKGAATFATGLADSTYQNQFNNAQTRSQDYLNLNTGQQANAQGLYSRLSGTASLGENAAASTGYQGTTAANNAGNFLNSAGAYNAAGATGAGNAITGSATSGLNNFLSNSAVQAALGGNGQTLNSGTTINTPGNSNTVTGNTLMSAY